MNAAQLWFWATAALFTLLALGFVLCPLLRARPAAGISRKSLNIAIYRERAQGPAEYLNVEEAGQRLLQDATGTELAAAVVAQNGRRWPWIVGAALVLPLLAFGAYFQADTWRLLGSSREQPPVEYLLNRLRERVAATPEDADAHLLLARAYSALERYSEAIASYARANHLRENPDADALAEEAELRGLATRGDFRGAPLELFGRALTVDPAHPKSLWYMGLIAYNAGDRSQALDYWQGLAGQQLPEDFRAVLAQKITELGATPAQPPASLAITLPLRVSLSPKLAQAPPPDAVVFVFARAEEGGRPLAVLRRPASELPFKAELSDELSMAGGPALSAFDRWQVVARISHRGQPLAQSGDWFGERAVTRAEAGKGLIELVIDQVQP